MYDCLDVSRGTGGNGYAVNKKGEDNVSKKKYVRVNPGRLDLWSTMHYVNCEIAAGFVSRGEIVVF